MIFVLFKDSFERYDLGVINGALFDNFVSRYTVATNAGLEITASGRNGQAINLGSGVFSKTLPHAAHWVVGFAVQFNGTPSGENRVLQVFNTDNVFFTLLHDSDGTLSMRAGTNIAQAMGITDRALLAGRWYYIEVDVQVSAGTPLSVTAELRINGHVEIPSVSISSVYNATDNLSQDATLNVFTFANGMGTVGSGTVIDDLYIKNETGYEGDIRNVAVYPSGDGGTTAWTPNGGSSHFDRVDTHPVDLTKWLETATVGDIDLWTFVLPSFSGSIVAVNLSVLARKDDEGTKSFKIVVGPSGTDALSDEFFVSDVSPEYYEFSLKQNPTTSAAWAPGATITWGVKLIS